MANTGAAIVDRVLPDVPLRQYVLSLPFELRKLAAFKPDVLTALGRIFVDAIFASYGARAKRNGVRGAQCGAINFVQRFGSSVNLHVHFHVAVLDGVFVRDEQGVVLFHPSAPPTREDLDALVRRVQRRATAWLGRRGHLEDRPLEDRSNEPPAQTAIDACASLAMGRGHVATLPNAEEPEDDHRSAPGHSAVAVDRDGFNLHAGVRIEAGDDAGREKLCRYAARPPLSLERLRRLRGGRIAYRLKYVGRGRGKHRIMEPMEFMARLAALIAPPRYPLIRYAGVLGPRSAWRKEIVPRPRERPSAGGDGGVCPPQADRAKRRAKPEKREGTQGCESAKGPAEPNGEAVLPKRLEGSTTSPEGKQNGTVVAALLAPVVVALAPNILSISHWGRLLGGLLYAATPRLDWARLLRRTFDIDILECPRCHGRLRVLAVISEREPVHRILAHLGLPTEPPPIATARDPTDEPDDAEAPGQLELRHA
jgi:hypothetical protein